MAWAGRARALFAISASRGIPPALPGLSGRPGPNDEEIHSTPGRSGSTLGAAAQESPGLMSTEAGNILERRFHNRSDDLSHVTEEAVRFLEERGAGDRAVYAANLAIEEMATNILKYGYDDKAAHEILLRVEIHPGSLRLVLEDDGHEFNPLRAPEPDVTQPAEQRAPGGLGIHLVRKMVTEMTYERCGGQTGSRS